MSKCFEIIGDALIRKGGKNIVLEMDDIVHQTRDTTPIFIARTIHALAKDKIVLKDLAKTGYMMEYLKEIAQKEN